MEGSEAKTLLKIMLVGAAGAGKTSLFSRCVDNTFHDGAKATIGFDFKIKAVRSPKTSKILTLQIWDVSGQMCFNPQIPVYYRGVDGFLLLFDCTDRENSFQRIPKILEEITQHGKVGADKILVATKIDLADQRQVSYEEAKQLADQLGMSYIETSAKNNMNVDEAFTILALQAENSLSKQQKPIPPPPNDPTSPTPYRCIIS